MANPLPHDIETIVVGPSFPWLLILGLILLISAVAAAVWWWLRRKRKHDAPVAVDFFEDLLARLSRLESGNLDAVDAKAYASSLSEVARRLIERGGLAGATSMTTEELRRTLKPRGIITQADAELLQGMFQQMDRINYAGFPLEGESFLQSVRAVKALVVRHVAAQPAEAPDDLR